MLVNQVKLGIKKALPIGMGYFPLGLAFGVIAENAGLTAAQVGLMSLFIFSGSGQFVAVALISAGASFWAIISTILLVNSRYLLFSATLSQYVKKMPPWLTAIICQGLVDETFVVATAHFRENIVSARFWLSLNITSHLVWITSTVLGAVAGNFIPNLDSLGLDFALPAMFIALFFMTAANIRAVYCGIIAGIVSLVLIHFGFSNANIFLATIFAATVGVVLK
ncbi:MAG: AzlC family ABC transporter permease [Bacillota bacterium]